MLVVQLAIFSVAVLIYVYLLIYSQINHFQNGRQEVIITKYNLNKRPKITFKPSNITNL